MIALIVTERGVAAVRLVLTEGSWATGVFTPVNSVWDGMLGVVVRRGHVSRLGLVERRVR